MPGTLASSPVSLHSEPDMLPFSKDPSGRYIVLYTFIARDENDVSVERGEFVTGISVFYSLAVQKFITNAIFLRCSIKSRRS